jgi:hypothetical protein
VHGYSYIPNQKLKEEGRKGKIRRKKTSKNLLFRPFYTGRKNVTNKSCLFYAKFFEFEVKT